MADDTVVFYITCSDMAEARYIGGELVKNKLAACVNIFGPMESVFEWEGVVKNIVETCLIAKTLKSKSDEFIFFVNQIHSYDVPCIISFDIKGGYPPFLKWIEGCVNI